MWLLKILFWDITCLKSRKNSNSVFGAGKSNACARRIFWGTVCWIKVSKESTPIVCNMADISAESALLWRNEKSSRYLKFGCIEMWWMLVEKLGKNNLFLAIYFSIVNFAFSNFVLHNEKINNLWCSPVFNSCMYVFWVNGPAKSGPLCLID